MSTTFAQFVQSLDFGGFQPVLNGPIGRLLVACLLGGAIGVERESKHKASGVRTNMLICMGSAFFTLLSAALAGDPGEKTRIASNIVQGIGFLGAGLILHNRDRISGLTSAATVFVVASIGMACGAGSFAGATAATAIVLLALLAVGILEQVANLKKFAMIYEARGRDQTAMLKSILDAMDKACERLANTDRDSIGELQRVCFTLIATKRRHQRLRTQLLAEPSIDALLNFRDPEED
ncbi:MAG: MgtC/SapB family protein [Terracidiphilus sp.]